MLKQLNPKRDVVAEGILRKFNQTHFECTMTRERNGPLTINTLRCNQRPNAPLHDSLFESLGCRHFSITVDLHERESVGDILHIRDRQQARSVLIVGFAK